MGRVFVGFLLFAGCSDSIIDAPVSGSTGASSSADSGTDGVSSSSGSTSTPATSGVDGSSSGENPSEEEPWTAGARLQPVFERDAEGHERLVRWFDTELGVDCYFAEVVDGHACRPLTYWSAGTFADASCSQPATQSSSCAEVPAYGSFYELGCAPPTPMRRGDAVDVLYLRDDDGACVQAPWDGGFRLEPIPHADLVTATRSVTEADDGLGRWEFAGDDGTKQWVGPVDLSVDNGYTCRPIEVDGAFACVTPPFASAAVNVHQGANCRGGGVALAFDSESCPDPRFVTDGGAGYGTITGPLDPETLWEGTGESCEPLWHTPEAQRSYFSFRPFELGDAPLLEVERVGSGRLRMQQPRALGGESLGVPSFEWFDTELNTSCIHDPNASRCRPLTSVGAYFFSDPSCVTPLVTEVRTSAEWLSLHEYSSECLSVLVGAIRLGGLHTGEVYRLDDVEGCSPINGTGTLYEIAGFVPVEELPELEQVRP